MHLSLQAYVAARTEDVWNLLVDIERWPHITASIRRIERIDDGPLNAGSEAIVHQPRLPAARWKVTDLVVGRSFTWETRSTGLTTIGGHRVDPDGEGSTMTLTLEQRGPLAFVAGALLGDLMRRYVAMELAGFKATAENAERLGADEDS